MKRVNGFVVVCAAIIFALVIANLQLAWNLRTAAYLEGVAKRADTASAVATALPEYASKKLPDPEATKAVFTKNVSPGSVDLALQSLYSSISAAYQGKTDTVSLDMAPIVRPVQSAGYQIPPGTVFANETVGVGGIAPSLHLAQRSLIPSILLLAAFLAVAAVLASKRNPLRAVRSILLVTALILGGLYIATLGLPLLVSSLVSSTNLDAAMRDILLDFTNILIADAGRYYIVWIVILLIAAFALSVVLGLMHRRKKPARTKLPPKQPKSSVEEF